MDGFSGAEIKAVATEAGYAAIRSDRVRVTADDFWQAIAKVKEGQGEQDEPPGMFG
jgi:ATP-dependent 26S proteasome regulatory subunit